MSFDPLTRKTDNGLPWINPIGGLGDMLMVGGVLKQLVERDPAARFNLVQRTRYRGIFENHPAIAHIGYPDPDARILRVDYWSMEPTGPGAGPKRPYQILARGFGLPTPIGEKLYLAGAPDEDPVLHHSIPWGKINVAIAPATDSPRKAMHPGRWHRLVELLTAHGAFVLQVGLLREIRIRNAYGVRGVTTPQQTAALLRRCDLLIAPDNFLTHAAKMMERRAVVLWGPTSHKTYGYPEHFHLQTAPACGLPVENGCIHNKAEGETGFSYGTPCPLGEPRHCCDTLTPEKIFEVTLDALAGKKPYAVEMRPAHRQP